MGNSPEIAKKAPANKTKLLELKPDQKEKLIQLIPELRMDLADFKKYYNNLKNKYPEAWGKIASKHHHITKQLDLMIHVIDKLDATNLALKNIEIIQAIDEYNLFAKEINEVFAGADLAFREEIDQTIGLATQGELPFDEKDFTADEKAEFKKFMEDLMAELFPESNVDKFVRWTTGRKSSDKLEDHEKYLLAPANGIESAIMGVAALFDQQTYQDFVSGIILTSGLTWKDWCNYMKALKVGFEQLPTSSKIAPMLSLLCAFAFLAGGTSKIVSMTSKLKCGAKIANAVKVTVGARTMVYKGAEIGKGLAILPLTQLKIKYINIIPNMS